MIDKVDYSITIVVGVCVVTSTIAISVNALGVIKWERIVSVESSIVIDVIVSVVTSTVTIGVGVFCAIVWERIF